jgi:hypothetical protein
MTEKEEVELAVDHLMRATPANPEIALKAAKAYYQHISKVTKSASVWMRTIELLAHPTHPPVS